MAVNPLRFKPTEILRLLNSTPVGTVANERLLRRHRDAARMNISDDAGKTVNIFKYAAWLTLRWLGATSASCPRWPIPRPRRPAGRISAYSARTTSPRSSASPGAPTTSRPYRR